MLEMYKMEKCGSQSDVYLCVCVCVSFNAPKTHINIDNFLSSHVDNEKLGFW